MEKRKKRKASLIKKRNIKSRVLANKVKCINISCNNKKKTTTTTTTQ